MDVVEIMRKFGDVADYIVKLESDLEMRDRQVKAMLLANGGRIEVSPQHWKMAKDLRLSVYLGNGAIEVIKY